MNGKTPKLLVSNRRGRIFSHEYLDAAGMKAGHHFRLDRSELIELPPGSRLFMLPHRSAVGYAPYADRPAALDEYSAVAAFLPPGYTGTFSASYKEMGNRRLRVLPLFAYTAVTLYKGIFYTAAIKVDNDRRHDSRFIDPGRVQRKIKRFRKIFARNRLIAHLEGCAMRHGCPGAQNFFLSRYEGPLPTSPFCNATCLGCISHQVKKKCAATQPRIRFVPAPEEISEIALFHMANVKGAVVSFGQGCDGEPLLAGDVIEQSIRLIRKNTSRGIINMNTNASRPDVLRRLFDAGLDSIRVSLNSARPLYYTRYYKPAGYTFNDVVRSVKMAKRRGRFVSVNYLTMPGFTDSKEEFRAFKAFIGDNRVDMVQWRNLNFDPLHYFKELRVSVRRGDLIGVREVMARLRKESPRIMTGYFNPMKRKMKLSGF